MFGFGKRWEKFLIFALFSFLCFLVICFVLCGISFFGFFGRHVSETVRFSSYEIRNEKCDEKNNLCMEISKSRDLWIPVNNFDGFFSPPFKCSRSSKSQQKLEYVIINPKKTTVCKFLARKRFIFHHINPYDSVKIKNVIWRCTFTCKRNEEERFSSSVEFVMEECEYVEEEIVESYARAVCIGRASELFGCDVKNGFEIESIGQKKKSKKKK